MMKLKTSIFSWTKKTNQRISDITAVSGEASMKVTEKTLFMCMCTVIQRCKSCASFLAGAWTLSWINRGARERKTLIFVLLQSQNDVRKVTLLVSFCTHRFLSWLGKILPLLLECWVLMATVEVSVEEEPWTTKQLHLPKNYASVSVHGQHLFLKHFCAWAPMLWSKDVEKNCNNASYSFLQDVNVNISRFVGRWQYWWASSNCLWKLLTTQ